MARRTVDDARIFEPLVGVGRAQRGIAENLGEAENGVKRRAQLVAHIGEQTIFERPLQPGLLARRVELRAQVARGDAFAQRRDQRSGAIAAPAHDAEHPEIGLAAPHPHRGGARLSVGGDGGELVEKARPILRVQAIDKAVTGQRLGVGRHALDECHAPVDAMAHDDLARQRQRRVGLGFGRQRSRAAESEGRAESGERQSARPFQAHRRQRRGRRRNRRASQDQGGGGAGESGPDRKVCICRAHVNA